MKKIIIGLLVLVLVILWYIFAPIKWTFGLRAPKNYQECESAGGSIKIDNSGLFAVPNCSYKNKFFTKDVM